MNSLKNVTIRKKIMSSGLTYKQVSAQMNVSASRLSHILAYDLRPNDRERIETAIAKAKQEQRKN